MGWRVEYYEQEDTVQPAEVFEDALKRTHRKLATKLESIVLSLEIYGPRLGGGLIEACRGYSGLWELRAIFSGWLGREMFGFDGERVVLLHGYIKRAGEPASARDLKQAFAYWQDYQRTHRISPEIPEEEA
ncbi:MAG TPA: hypothetical protein VH599_08505 [Ktedonobacterales bacterium]|jgi:hypothetical protein